jgi:hypothetical protein
MRFINKNQNVNSISLRAVNGAGSMVLRSYQSLVLRLERICTGLTRAAIQKQLWPLTVGDQCFGINHQTMYLPALDTGSMRIYGTTANSGEPATLRQRPAGLGLS